MEFSKLLALKVVKWYIKLLSSKIIMGVLTVIVYACLSIPFILFHIYLNKEDIAVNSSNNSMCSTSVLYNDSNGVCQNTLKEVLISLQCSSDIETLSVAYDAEDEARRIIERLNLEGASEECKRESTPFICLTLFGLCGGTEEAILQPNSTDCEWLRDEICQEEWKYLNISDCTKFPSESRSCEEAQINSSFAQFNCSEGFFYDSNSSTCVPDCYSWTLRDKTATARLDGILCAFFFMGLIGSVIFLVVSGIRYKSMLTIPPIFIFYIAIDTAILDLIGLVSVLGRHSVFCTSHKLLESEARVNPFCSLSGMLNGYLLVQFSHWVVAYIFHIFLAVYFPIWFQVFQNTKKKWYLHAATVLIGAIVPLVPVVISVADSHNLVQTNPWFNGSVLSNGLGFSTNLNSNTVCVFRNPYIFIYSQLLISCLYIIIGILFVNITLWKLFKRSHDSSVTLGTPEMKILTGYAAVAVGVMGGLIVSSAIAGKGPHLRHALHNYFNCEQKGYEQNAICSRSEIHRYDYTVEQMFFYVTIGILPPFMLIFAVNVQETKKSLKNLFPKLIS